MDTALQTCQICISPLAPEIDLKKNWRTDRLVRWAQKRGLDCSLQEIEQHLKSHVNGQAKKADPNSNGKESSPEEKCQAAVSVPCDEKFLNLIIDSVHQNVAANRVELKIEHAFKAIELKQKLAESGNVENMLLELLNEIRRQELGKQPSIRLANNE